jgi:hypothetical protein
VLFIAVLHVSFKNKMLFNKIYINNLRQGRKICFSLGIVMKLFPHSYADKYVTITKDYVRFANSWMNFIFSLNAREIPIIEIFYTNTFKIYIQIFLN